MTEPSLLGVIDTYGSEGRSERQIGGKGQSNWRWIVGGKLCLLLNHLGLVVGWACDSAHGYDGTPADFQALVDAVAEQCLCLVMLASLKKTGIQLTKSLQA